MPRGSSTTTPRRSRYGKQPFDPSAGNALVLHHTSPRPSEPSTRGASPIRHRDAGRSHSPGYALVPAQVEPFPSAYTRATTGKVSVRWQYLDGESKWVSFSDDESDRIESAFASGVVTTELPGKGGRISTFDFGAMTMAPLSGGEMKIRRNEQQDEYRIRPPGFTDFSVQFVRRHNPKFNIHQEGFFGGTCEKDEVEGSEATCAEVVSTGHVWTGEKDGTIRIWNAKTGQRLRTTEQKKDIYCSSLLEVPATDGVVTVWAGFTDAVIRVFNASHPYEVKLNLRRHGPGSRINCLVPQIGGRCVFSGGQDGQIFQWDIRTYECTNQFSGHRNGVRCLIADADILYSGSDDGTIAVWDIYGRDRVEWRGHSAGVHHLVKTDRHIWSGSEDETVRIWNVDTGECLCVLREPHSGMINSMALVGDKVWTSSAGSIFIWSAQQIGQPPVAQYTSNHIGYITNMPVIHKSILVRVWTTGKEGKIKIWNAECSADYDPEEILRPQLDKKKQEVCYLKERLSELEEEYREHSAQSETRIDKLKNEVSQLQNDLAEKIAQLANTKQELASAKHKATVMENNMKRHDERLYELERDLSIEKSKAAGIDLVHQKELVQARKDSVAREEDSIKKLSRLETQLADAQRELAKIEELQKTLDHFEGAQGIGRSGSSPITVRVRALVEENQRQASRLADLAKELERKDDELQRVRAKGRKSQEDAEGLQDELRKARSEGRRAGSDDYGAPRRARRGSAGSSGSKSSDSESGRAGRGGRAARRHGDSAHLHDVHPEAAEHLQHTDDAHEVEDYGDNATSDDPKTRELARQLAAARDKASNLENRLEQEKQKSERLNDDLNREKRRGGSEGSSSDDAGKRRKDSSEGVTGRSGRDTRGGDRRRGDEDDVRREGGRGDRYGDDDAHGRRGSSAGRDVDVGKRKGSSAGAHDDDDDYRGRKDGSGRDDSRRRKGSGADGYSDDHDYDRRGKRGDKDADGRKRRGDGSSHSSDDEGRSGYGRDKKRDGKTVRMGDEEYVDDDGNIQRRPREGRYKTRAGSASSGSSDYQRKSGAGKSKDRRGSKQSDGPVPTKGDNPRDWVYNKGSKRWANEPGSDIASDMDITDLCNDQGEPILPGVLQVRDDGLLFYNGKPVCTRDGSWVVRTDEGRFVDAHGNLIEINITEDGELDAKIADEQGQQISLGTPDGTMCTLTEDGELLYRGEVVTGLGGGKITWREGERPRDKNGRKVLGVTDYGVAILMTDKDDPIVLPSGIGGKPLKSSDGRQVIEPLGGRPQLEDGTPVLCGNDNRPVANMDGIVAIAGEDGTVFGPDGNVIMGPDGNTPVTLSPTGTPRTTFERNISVVVKPDKSMEGVLPPGTPVQGRDGRAITGPSSKVPVVVGADGRSIIGPDGKMAMGPDGYPVTVGPTGRPETPDRTPLNVTVTPRGRAIVEGVGELHGRQDRHGRGTDRYGGSGGGADADALAYQNRDLQNQLADMQDQLERALADLDVERDHANSLRAKVDLLSGELGRGAGRGTTDEQVAALQRELAKLAAETTRKEEDLIRRESDRKDSLENELGRKLALIEQERLEEIAKFREMVDRRDESLRLFNEKQKSLLGHIKQLEDNIHQANAEQALIWEKHKNPATLPTNELIYYYKYKEEQYAKIGGLNQQLHEENAGLMGQTQALTEKLHFVSFVIESRPSLLKVLYDLYKMCVHAKKTIDKFAKEVSVRERTRRELLDNIGGIRTEVVDVMNGEKWLIANMFTEYELLHLGTSPSFFVPDGKRFSRFKPSTFGKATATGRWTRTSVQNPPATPRASMNLESPRTTSPMEYAAGRPASPQRGVADGMVYRDTSMSNQYY